LGVPLRLPPVFCLFAMSIPEFYQGPKELLTRGVSAMGRRGHKRSPVRSLGTPPARLTMSVSTGVFCE